MPRIAAVINPNCTGDVPGLEARIRESFKDIEFTGLEDLDDYTHIAIAGGDGTFNSIINSRGYHGQVIIPLGYGSGSFIQRRLGVYSWPIERIAQLLESETQVTDMPAISVTGPGINATAAVIGIGRLAEILQEGEGRYKAARAFINQHELTSLRTPAILLAYLASYLRNQDKKSVHMDDRYSSGVFSAVEQMGGGIAPFYFLEDGSFAGILERYDGRFDTGNYSEISVTTEPGTACFLDAETIALEGGELILRHKPKAYRAVYAGEPNRLPFLSKMMMPVIRKMFPYDTAS